MLDWPELRTAFAQHDAPGKRGKRTSHVQGLLSVGLAGLGVIILGLNPALPKSFEHGLTIVALVLMTLGGALGVLHWLVLRSKYVWLGHRFWTERLRQLYFQSLTANLDLLSSAMIDDAFLSELLRLRRVWLDDFVEEARHVRVAITDILEDRTESKAWLRPEWAASQRSNLTRFR